MTYQLKHADALVADIPVSPLTQDSTSTSLTFVGRGVPNFGQIHQTNFLQILENFASETPPLHPIVGQNWFKKSDKSLYVWDGATWSISQTCACTVSPTPPTYVCLGQMWYNTSISMLMVQVGATSATSKWVTAIDESLLYLGLLT